ncbi:hypothetical protein ERUR111494_04240 [Erysipelothrix urinaevulpis]|uniref:hypothetical protein n=1 Tax=Erysipelothrix urinaevulpis TaxID=2683717 RepID=UPI0013599ED7|nr:hypothetical protein [Erysipelothrix urinaevulpis]
MKKLVSVLIVLLLITACSTTKKPEEEVKVPEESETIATTEDEKENEVEEPKEEEKEEPKKEETEKLTETPKVMSRDEFIVSTFSKYGYNADLGNFRINNQGPKKVVAIYKQPVSKGRPIINKMVFLADDSNGNHELLFVMVNNQVKFGNDQ